MERRKRCSWTPSSCHVTFGKQLDESRRVRREHNQEFSWFKILLNASKVFSTLLSDPWLEPESLIITRFQMERNHQTHSGFILMKTQGNMVIFPIHWFIVHIRRAEISDVVAWSVSLKNDVLMTLKRKGVSSVVAFSMCFISRFTLHWFWALRICRRLQSSCGRLNITHTGTDTQSWG